MRKIKSTNPYNGEVIGQTTISSKEEVNIAVQKARKAFNHWSELTIKQRIEKLRGLVPIINTRKRDIVNTITAEIGKPIVDSEIDLKVDLQFIEWYLENAQKSLSQEVTFRNHTEIHFVEYEPTGVAGVIAPWNFPFSNFIWGVLPNLIVGNTVVFKHSEQCILTAKLIDTIVQELSLPEGVFNQIYGDGEQGEYLVNEDIDLVSFTGSTETGVEIYTSMSKRMKKVVLELGGSAPGIIFDNYDKDSFRKNFFFQKFMNCGQICDGLKRLIVEETIYESVKSDIVYLLQKQVVGDPTDRQTTIGTLVSEKQADILESQLNEAILLGAKIVFGGKRIGRAIFEPTLIEGVDTSMRIWREEVFGPILPIISFTDEVSAVELANATEFGLGGYIYSSDNLQIKRVSKALRTGMVSINGINYVKACNPFGGYKMSGIGREHGKYGLQELCERKVTAMPRHTYDSIFRRN